MKRHGGQTSQRGEVSAKGPSFAAFGMDEIRKNWNGAWVIKKWGRVKGKKSSYRALEAWHVEGEKLTIFDGKTETITKINIASPCTIEVSGVAIRNTKIRGTQTRQFVFEGNGVFVGMGEVALRKGNLTIGCNAFGIHILENNGKCTQWIKRFRKWRKKQSKCSLSKADGLNWFSMENTLSGGRYSVAGKGDVMALGNMQKHDGKRMESFEAAKKIVTESLKQ